MSAIIEAVKKFDYKRFHWREACSGPDGKSSAGRFLCFWFGVVLILLSFLGGLLYCIKWVNSSQINNIFIFVGLMMPIVLGYLLGNKNLDNKTTINEKVNIPPTADNPS